MMQFFLCCIEKKIQSFKVSRFLFVTIYLFPSVFFHGAQKANESRLYKMTFKRFLHRQVDDVTDILCLYSSLGYSICGYSLLNQRFHCFLSHIYPFILQDLQLHDECTYLGVHSQSVSSALNMNLLMKEYHCRLRPVVHLYGRSSCHYQARSYRLCDSSLC